MQLPEACCHGFVVFVGAGDKLLVCLGAGYFVEMAHVLAVLVAASFGVGDGDLGDLDGFVGRPDAFGGPEGEIAPELGLDGFWDRAQGLEEPIVGDELSVRVQAGMCPVDEVDGRLLLVGDCRHLE